jgi:hypothetical protein
VICLCFSQLLCLRDEDHILGKVCYNWHIGYSRVCMPACPGVSLTSDCVSIQKENNCVVSWSLAQTQAPWTHTLFLLPWGTDRWLMCWKTKNTPNKHLRTIVTTPWRKKHNTWWDIHSSVLYFPHNEQRLTSKGEDKRLTFCEFIWNTLFRGRQGALILSGFKVQELTCTSHTTS